MSQANNRGKNVPDTGNSKSNALRQEETGHVLKMVKKGDFPGGPVVMNPPCNAGDTGSPPGRGTKISHAAEQVSPYPATTEPMRYN